MRTQIASIYFAPVRAERPFGGPYELAPVSLGASPMLLNIDDRLQIEQGPYQLSSDGNHRSRRQFLVLGEAIARDVVDEWTTHGLGMNPQCHPGIWVVRQTVPVMREDGTPEKDADGRTIWRPATTEEREAMWLADLEAAKAADRNYAYFLYTAANATAEDARLIPFISKTAKLGAKQYGLEAEWLKEGADLQLKTCPYCTRAIPAAAIKCPRCAEIVDIEEYARREVIRKAEVGKMQLELARQRSEERAAQSVLARKQAAAARLADEAPAPEDSAHQEAPEEVNA